MNEGGPYIDDLDPLHIFREAAGHMPDTPESRNALIGLASGDRNFVGKDRYGTCWYATMLDDGRQLWAQVRDNRIRNGGMNEAPRDYFSPLTGFAKER